MAITYKPVAIIIDDFTSRSLTNDNVSLYEAGSYNTFTDYDYYTLDGYYVDGYGDVDSTAITSYGTFGYYQNFGFDYFESDSYTASAAFTGIYGYTAYAYDYPVWISHNPSSELTEQHGDWSLDAFINQLDSDVEVILIDFDSNGGYMDSNQSGLLFSNIDYIVGDWLLNNDTDSIEYLPVVVSASFGGVLPSIPESYALDLFTAAYTSIVQAVPNVTQGGFTWGDVYSNVINVGAYNVDTNSNSLHGNPVNPSVIDILANGYVEHSGWGNGWNFGTSFATPRVSAEIANLWIELLDSVNADLASGEITQEDIESSSGITYTDYINSILDLITTDVFVEIDNIWYSDSIAVLSDDVASSPIPVQVTQTNIGLTQYHVTNATYALREEVSLTPEAIKINTIINEVLTKFGYTSINGLVSSWNDETNTVSYSWENGTNTYISIADYISPSQANISNVVTFILNEMGYSYISGLESAWVTETNELGIAFDSAQAAGLNLTDIKMYLDLDESGNVSAYLGQGYNSTY